MIRFIAGIAFLLCLNASRPATAAMYVIENPASKISNPADGMNNPATQGNNPAAQIYNPASRMENRNPLSPPKPVPEPAATATSTKAGPAKTARQQYKPEIPRKSYHFQSVGAYLLAAKKAFINDDFLEFVSITEDALRRINAGTLKAPAKSKHILHKYQVFGYGLLGNGDGE